MTSLRDDVFRFRVVDDNFWQILFVEGRDLRDGKSSADVDKVGSANGGKVVYQVKTNGKWLMDVQGQDTFGMFVGDAVRRLSESAPLIDWQAFERIDFLPIGAGRFVLRCEVESSPTHHRYKLYDTDGKALLNGRDFNWIIVVAIADGRYVYSVRYEDSGDHYLFDLDCRPLDFPPHKGWHRESEALRITLPSGSTAVFPPLNEMARMLSSPHLPARLRESRALGHPDADVLPVLAKASESFWRKYQRNLGVL